MTEPVIPNLQKEKIIEYLDEGKRLDGRKPEEYREISVERGVSVNSASAVKVKIGNTEVMAGVHVLPAVPYPDSPDEGTMMFSAELHPMASEHFERGKPGINAIELSRVVDRGIRESGLIDTKDERYRNAMINYSKSAQVYNSLKKLKDSIEYELQEQIQMSSYYEVVAKDLISKDNNEAAAKNFHYARQTLNRVLEKIPSEELKDSFKPQIMYFEAMHLFCTAVVEYDQLETGAIDHFNEASERLSQAKEIAESLNNVPLIDSCTEAINKLDSYLNIAEIMFQSSDSEE